MNRIDLSHCVLATMLLAGAMLFPPPAHSDASPHDSTGADSSSGAGSTALAGVSDAAPVVFASDTLFVIHVPLGPFSPADRARAIEQRMHRFADDPLVRFDSVIVVESDLASDVMAGDVVLLTVTDVDARAAGKPRQVLAGERARVVGQALRGESFWASVKVVALGVLFTLIATIVLALILRALGKGLRRFQGALESWRGTRIRPLRIKTAEILSAERMTDLLSGAARFVRLATIVVLLYFYVPLVFSFFPWTRTLGTTLLGYVVNPLKQTLLSFVGYVPKMFTISVVAAVTYYLLRVIHLIFRAIGSGNLQFKGFHRDWAEPTYNIARVLVLAFALVVIFPYLPGAGSDAFKGVTVFFGILLSLGSSSAIANAVAGTVITYMRPFKPGDRVKIADTTGDVVERTLLVTRIRTIKNVDITIPNAMVLASHITNYGSGAENRRLILHTTVTIGYDAPWREVHALLLAAANATENVLKEPHPFILQTSLDDFYVSYELNVFTDKPNIMADTYSNLHQNIQDKFNEGGVEIMSPHYGALRDGNQTTIPEGHLEKDYKAPSFRIFPTGLSPGGGDRK